MNMKQNRLVTYLLAGSFFLTACGSEKEKNSVVNTPVAEEKSSVQDLGYSLGLVRPHDSTSFTEGLLFYDNNLLESTGSPAGSNFKSVLGLVDSKTGKIDVKVSLDAKYFGEGIVVLKDKIYHITYEDQLGFIYDAKTYKKIGQFNYSNKQGWGMTADGTNIIMSDGTEVLTYFDTDFKLVKTLPVKENGFAKENLNELEFINGFIYANIWLTNDIVKIDPATGNVIARINLTALSYNVKNFHPYALEMNGIAYDPKNDKIYVTGKAWPKIYEIKFPH